MRVDQHGQHAQSFVVFDEAHAAHVGGELKDNLGAGGGQEAGIFILQVEGEALYVVGDLVPLVERFDVDGANDLDAVVEQVLHEMAADESAGTADDCLFSFELHLGEGSFWGLTSLKLLGKFGLPADRLAMRWCLFKYSWGRVGFRRNTFEAQGISD